VRGPPHRNPNEQREQLPAVEGAIADATELGPGVRVVYPNQGVCEVVGVEEKDIAGQKLEFVRMRREEDGAAVLVPKNKVASIGLRRVASGEQMEGVFHYLAATFDDPELDWKVRSRDNADRLIAGGVLGAAEVVKGLQSLSRIRPLPTKERELYDGARHLLVSEISASLGVPPALAEDYVDFSLLTPAGVKLVLKPPPTPVLLPSRPKKRRFVAADDDESDDLSDLGLGDLGVEARSGEDGEEVAESAGASEGVSEVSGEDAPAPPAKERDAATASARSAGRKPAAPPREKGASARKTGAKAPAPKKGALKAPKTAAKKAPRAPKSPAKPAAKKPTKKAAPKTAGRKKR